MIVHDDAPAADDDPAGHGMHTDDPVVQAYVPAKHDVHVDPAVEEYVPTAQGMQNDSPAADDDPRAQGVQLKSPNKAAYVPGSQGVQTPTA